MQTESWLPLTEYASKYRISISTLRRRIKAESIPFRFDNGKYLISDVPPEEHDLQRPFAGLPPISAEPLAAKAAPLRQEPVVTTPDLPLKFDERDASEPILSTATKLLNELKKAYMSILQEKEAQIIQLKREASDLKTLVRVLEEDNERMKAILKQGEVVR